MIFLTFIFCFQLWKLGLLFIIGGILGSYLPDCDYMFAPMGRLIKLWKHTGHRQHTHSIFFAILCSCLCAVINGWLGLGCLVGMILHLMGDKTTYMGQIEGLRYLMWPYKINEKIKRGV